MRALPSKMVYHNGPVLTGTKSIYLIWYGCWGSEPCGADGDNQTMELMFPFLITIGGSPYAQINSTYTDASGQPATSSFGLGGIVNDYSYSRGVDLHGNFAHQETTCNNSPPPSRMELRSVLTISSC